MSILSKGFCTYVECFKTYCLLEEYFIEKFYFFVTTMSYQDPDPHGNQVWIHNTDAGVLKKLSLAGLDKLS
jgi:hypothetical protein